jgi:hypothetical protein
MQVGAGGKRQTLRIVAPLENGHDSVFTGCPGKRHDPPGNRGKSVVRNGKIAETVVLSAIESGRYEYHVRDKPRGLKLRQQMVVKGRKEIVIGNAAEYIAG